MQRYYGQSYARIDDPATPAIGLSQYQAPAGGRQLDHSYEAYRGPQGDALPSQNSGYEQYRREAILDDQNATPAPDDFHPRGTSPLPPSKRDPLAFLQPHAKLGQWSRRKLLIWSSVAVALVLIVALAIGLGVGLSHDGFSYTPSFAQVNNAEAFSAGGATHNSVNDTSDGIGAGQDVYTYYSGTEANFPDYSKWVSFEDMWANNLQTLQTSCATLNEGSNNS